MFGLLLVTIAVAVVTERNQEIATAESIAKGKNMSEDLAFEQTGPDQNGITNIE